MRNFYVWMEAFSKIQVQKANSAYDKHGFWSSIPLEDSLPIILRFLQKHPKSKVLDYGAGKDPVITKWLSENGFNVTAHEIGDNITSDHDNEALKYKYDLVIALNVLNVQQDKPMLNKSLEQIKDALKHGGLLIATFPKFPNETGMGLQEFKKVFKLHFAIVKFKNLKSGGIIAKAKV